MIKFDYKIQRDEGDQIIEYKPVGIPRNLDGLTFIEGPNSSGKSTILHIIALGLYGLKNKKIHGSLIEKMDSLINSDYQDTIFNLEISNKENNIIISAEKKDPNSGHIDVYETINNQKKAIPYNIFSSKYNVIYDIPNNPIGRLNELTNDLLLKQNVLGNRIQQLNTTIRKIINEIKNSKDPKKILEAKSRLKKIDKELDEEEMAKDSIKKEFEILRLYTYIRFYLEYYNKNNKLKKEISKIKKDEKQESLEKKIITKEIDDFYKKGLEYINLMKANINEISSYVKKLLPPKYHAYLRIWEKLNLKEILYDYGIEDGIIQGVEYYKKLLEMELISNKDNSKFVEAKFFEALIELLTNYQEEGSEILIPGLQKTITEFIEILKAQYKDHDIIKTKIYNIEAVIDLLDDLESRREFLVENYIDKMKKIEKQKAEEVTAGDDISDGYNNIQIIKLEQNLGEAKLKLEEYQTRLIKLDLKIDKNILNIKLRELKRNKLVQDHEIFNEEQLRKKIFRLFEDKKEKQNIISGIQQTKLSFAQYLEEMEKKKPHKYTKYIDFLNDLSDKSLLLSQLIMSNFNKNLNALARKEKPFPNAINQIRYNNAVSYYLGKKVKAIRHTNGKDLEIEKVDLLNGCITSKDGKVIYLNDLGTGHSQAAYLRGILNSNDGRKIIALIDEVAMMDNETLGSVTKMLKTLYEEGTLLAGIVVQRANKVKVYPIK